MMHRSLDDDELADLQGFVEGAYITEIQNGFDVEKVDRELNRKCGADFPDAARGEIDCVIGSDYLFDFHSGHDLVGKDIPELCHDGQGFLFHGCQNQNSHKRLQRHFTPASPRAQEYNFGIYFD